MKGQPKTMDNRESACTGDYKSTEEEILLHHILIKLRYLKDGRETAVCVGDFDRDRSTVQRLTGTCGH